MMASVPNTMPFDFTNIKFFAAGVQKIKLTAWILVMYAAIALHGIATTGASFNDC
ncbi:hypothetical protein [Candidatus Parabeggiatoa sp. HSG14]|uniref:hypothetical protein n=1 Tax=Candidatus Parabeggiatoa sp. HSG14 TaxID=3055593 RepID=UPI0025A6F216|nr:hypothetical protein [Thiotrichales bacterium HSG14]